MGNISKDNLYWQYVGWIVIALLMLLIGWYIYYVKIWKKHHKEMPDSKNFFNSLSYIFGYTPSGNIWHQIFGGIFLSLGICLLLGYLIGYIIDSTIYNYHSFAITLTTTFFSIICALISFGTLNQTKKIEFLQGDKVVEFSDLIERLAEDLEKIEDEYNENYEKRAEDYFKVYVLTQHPFFGTMSFPKAKPTRRLLLHYHSIDKLARTCPADKKFVFEIICADNNLIQNYIQDYYSNKSNHKEKSIDAINAFEKEIIQFNTVTRVPQLPNMPQFVIIGNTIYDFIISAKAPHSEIIETHVVKDRRRLDIYIETFNILKKTLIE